jgi:hypothetical protein
MEVETHMLKKKKRILCELYFTHFQKINVFYPRYRFQKAFKGTVQILTLHSNVRF